MRSAGTKGEWGVRGEMRWVHLRISTRVRVLGRLGCTGEFSRRTEQHARGPVKKIVVRYLQLKTGLQIENLAKLCRAGCTTCNIYNRNTQVFTVKNVEDAHSSFNTFVVKSWLVRRLEILGYASIHLWWSLESGPADYNWVRETRRRSSLPPPPGLTRAAGKRRVRLLMMMVWGFSPPDAGLTY